MSSRRESAVPFAFGGAAAGVTVISTNHSRQPPPPSLPRPSRRLSAHRTATPPDRRRTPDRGWAFKTAAVTMTKLCGAYCVGGYCLAEVKVGPCRAAFPRWRYDGVEQQCQAFAFGGCKGNLNNFLSRQDCVKACGGVAGNSCALSRAPALSRSHAQGVVLVPRQ